MYPIFTNQKVFLPPAEQLRPGSGKTMVAQSAAGHSKLRSILGAFEKQTRRDFFCMQSQKAKKWRDLAQINNPLIQPVLLFDKGYQRNGLCTGMLHIF
jgi:hypothetical protein